MPSSASYCDLPDLHPFPTRRSSDLLFNVAAIGGKSPRNFDCRSRLPRGSGAVKSTRSSVVRLTFPAPHHGRRKAVPHEIHRGARHVDRKSTRLNSSHLGISYAVFCFILRPP